MKTFKQFIKEDVDDFLDSISEKMNKSGFIKDANSLFGEETIEFKFKSKKYYLNIDNIKNKTFDAVISRNNDEYVLKDTTIENLIDYIKTTVNK